MDTHDDNQSDAALVARVLAGERAAFDPLLLRHYANVLRLCQRLRGPTPEAQDMAQDAALHAFLGLACLHEPARFGAWLHGICASTARNAATSCRTSSSGKQSFSRIKHAPLHGVTCANSVNV